MSAPLPPLVQSLSDYFYELAQQALSKVDPVPPAPSTPTRALVEAQAKNGEPAAIDWAMDTRPTYRLSDAEVLDKMNWQLATLTKREREFRAFEVPTVFPAGDQS